MTNIPLWEDEEKKGDRNWYWLLKDHQIYIETIDIDNIKNILETSIYVKSFLVEKCQNEFTNVYYYKINGCLKIKTKAIIPYSMSFNQMVEYLSN